ncbi:hypothetical protein PVAND_013731 [Polypedilum vanderplanki]|uniref:RB1-inducible coiled-coil protein 1 n=1 Tax=Polypedilum vanderplanki TaxID=319348 RepID=A0A9J6CR57_POLVA|nr:hypothetical protein PVAND_013731 [Polypedilum vanderplanki]
MLYIFNMDQGKMITFDVSLALDSVQSLKLTIERQHAIPACNQVLLVSGGETLDASNRVCSYSAGTDTNPIFMFSNSLEPRNQPQPWPSIDDSNEKADFKKEVDQCLEVPQNQLSVNLVARRVQIAQQIYEACKEELKNCDKLVHEQHLQHQGWMAVMANLEDITDAFEDRCNEFDKVFKEHIERRKEYKDYLESFDDDLERLAQIPILPPLIQGAEDQPFHAFDDVYNDTGESFAGNAAAQRQLQQESGGKVEKAASDTSMESNNVPVEAADKSVERSHEEAMKDSSNQKTSLTLLQWISSNENQKTLKRMAENCTRELDVFDKNVMDTLKDEIEKTVETAKREDMKEIKGLEERLQGLEALKRDAKKLLAEQNDLAQALLMNHNSVARSGDVSVLPDLCAPHKNQFAHLLRNLKKLRDIRIRCSKAKDELCRNLLQRLKFVIHIENRMCEIDCKLLFYHRCLRRLQKHLGIIEQIHQAPCVYVQAVTEVVRRRIFSTAFLMWASDLACHLLTIYNEEVMRRTDFRYSFDGHFLNTLFPGIDDFPPKFATEAPSIFDSNLPQLSKNDLNELSKHLPELTKKIQLPNLSAIIDFFTSRSTHSNQETTSTGGEDAVNPSNKKLLNVFAQMKDFEKGFESETDTEEYEKIGQMSIDKKPTHQSICVGTVEPELCDMATNMSIILKNDSEMVTDDNMLAGLEVNRMKEILITMYKISRDSVNLLKQQIVALKAEAVNENQVIKSQLETILKSYDDLKVETLNHERELIQRLTVDHELEMNDLSKKLFIKDDEINTLKNENEQLLIRLKNCEEKRTGDKSELENKIQEIQELKQKLQETEKKLSQQILEKDAAIKALKDDHRNEIESLRCKFKLITSMESSPSETSLDKIDTIDITTHETIIRQMKVNFEEEVQKAVKEAIEQERAKVAAKMTESTSKWSLTPSSPGKSPKDNQEIFKRILEEKDRQLDQMREREQFLIKESNQLKEIIQSLTDVELNESQVSVYKEKLEHVQSEKRKLEKDLEKEKAKRAKLNSLAQGNGGVTINSCSKDDIVLVVWNSIHEQYTIVQDSSILYFLHAESYNNLSLSTVPPNTCPRVCYCIGRVLDKEYCHAKKDENRYKVGKGTKFYRVKVRPRSPTNREMDRSTTERKKIKRSTDSQSDSSKSMRLERQPNNLIDSFAQTETHTDTVMTNVDIATTSSDMVDSGVGSQHKSSTCKERNNSSIIDEDEDISFADDRNRYKSVSEEDTEEAVGAESSDICAIVVEDEEKKEEEAPVIIKDQCEIASLDDSDEYRSLEGKDDTEDTEL